MVEAADIVNLLLLLLLLLLYFYLIQPCVTSGSEIVSLNYPKVPG